MTITLEDEVLTLTAVMVPGKLCSGHRDEIPGGLAYEDQHGWLWCLACAKHMTECTDETCDHPAAIFDEPDLAAVDPAGEVARCEHGDDCDFECAASLMSDEGEWGDWDDEDGAE